ncbi:cadherin-related family member 3-like [Trichosurus vulpecula]|uniref:cadherin-related family member 3-like n=1 Tax=Trichosurus vulpecula TaxID=9337 RepID=UPI00186AF137|nr:cadherin-related family member 3-like [Trichosurus vulpecula]
MNIFRTLLICSVFSKVTTEIQILINPVNLPENMPPGTQLSRAYDKDVVGKPDAYHFLNKTDEFIINPDSGVITSTKIFNFETDPRRFLFIVDTGGIMRHVLTINIIDLPEPPDCSADPQFSSGTATVAIDENYPLFQSIYRVMATDEDFADNGRLKYSIETQSSGPKNGANCFGVDPVTGIVSLRSEESLDFDAGYHVFQLSLRATDTTGLFCQGTLTIMIRNVNDEKPQFESFPFNSINVTEKKSVGDIIARAKATDRDEDSNITYSFKTQQTVFGLDPVTGIITLLQPLTLDNSNRPNAYPLEIEAKDNGNNTSSYVFTIFVEDVDDPVICDPGFSTGGGISVVIPENIPASAFIYMVLARDPDPGQEVERFQIVIAARTRGNMSLESCTGTITVNIQNVNDEIPVFAHLPDVPINIYENLPLGRELIKLTATDKDIGDSVHYEFVGTFKGFSINDDSGVITISQPLDYEDPAILHSWILKIRAYDNDRVHSTTGTLTVILQDVNDNPPQCTQDRYVIELPENIPLETHLLSLICTDKDGTDSNNNITYHLITDNFSHEMFTLINNEIKIGPNQLNYDNFVFAGMQFKYTLFVRVSDGGTPELSTIITIILRVTRKNELNPVSNMPAFTFSAPENSAIDTLIGRVVFTDADWPFNNIKYTIDGGNLGTPSKFYIEPNTGMIKLLDSLDREIQAQYKLVVRATDMDNDIEPDPLRQRSSSVLVTINVLNVNDEPPICNPPHLEKIIYAPTKIPFLQLNCSDKDSSHKELSYSIIRGNTNNWFTLERPGVDPPSLATTKNFQDDVFRGIQDPTTFQLLIEVTDELGGNKVSQLSTTTTIIIHMLPWTTTQPTTVTKTTMTTVTTSILLRISHYWRPDNWISAVITITGVLFLMSVYAVAWCLFKDTPGCSRFFPNCHQHQMSQPSITTKEIIEMPRTTDSFNSQQKSNLKPTLLPGNENAASVYDGRAIDPGRKQMS